MVLEKYSNFIGGEWVLPHAEDYQVVMNPANGSKLAKVPRSDRDDACVAVDAAREAFDKGKGPRRGPHTAPLRCSGSRTRLRMRSTGPGYSILPSSWRTPGFPRERSTS